MRCAAASALLASDVNSGLASAMGRILGQLELCLRAVSGKAAAQRANEGDVEREGARLQLRDGLAGGQKLVLHVQHVKIGVEAAFIALAGDRKSTRLNSIH